MTKISGGRILFITLAAAGSACSGGGTPDQAEAGASRAPTQGPSGQMLATLELDATYPEGFSFLNGIREMPDGSRWCRAAIQPSKIEISVFHMARPCSSASDLMLVMISSRAESSPLRWYRTLAPNIFT